MKYGKRCWVSFLMTGGIVKNQKLRKAVLNAELLVSYTKMSAASQPLIVRAL